MLNRRITFVSSQSASCTTGSNPVNNSPKAPISLIDFGKRESDANERTAPLPVRPVNRSLIDLGKKEPEARDLPAFGPKVQSTIPLIDLGKHPEMPQPEPRPLKPGPRLVLACGVLVAGGLTLWLTLPLHRAAAASEPNLAPLDTLTLPADTSALLQVTQLWIEYQDQLHRLIPGRDPHAPWWQGPAAGGLPEAQRDAVHQLQTETLRTYHRLVSSAPVSDDSSFGLILDSLDHLEQQQTAPIVPTVRTPDQPGSIQRLPPVAAPQLTQVPRRPESDRFPVPPNPRL